MSSGKPSNLTPRLRLRLTAAAETAVRSGHPWVYSEKVRETNRPGRAGELAVIYDRSNRFLALGFYDPDSALAVRILHRGEPVQLDPAWWMARLESTLGRRRGYFTADTDGYRLINGESDGWPGLVLDQYAGCLVLKLYTPSWLANLSPSLPETSNRLLGLDLVPLLQNALRPERIVLRLSRNLADSARRAGFVDGQNLLGSNADPSVIFHESGLRFESDVVQGQKTGFYLDQRENRRRIGALARGAEVLNVFSFSGGFSVHAARGGARSVTDLDISPHALASARRNFALNEDVPGFNASRHDPVQADAFEWLSQAPRQGWDIVILDPPSLARRESDRAGAIQAYHRLTRLGTERVRPGGWLLAASCSAHVSEAEFFDTVRQALMTSECRWDETETAGHAPDHPATFPEARYLKALYARCLGFKRHAVQGSRQP
jgi:23S rRNA (cytosine1962-C5)-methyltransferase